MQRLPLFLDRVFWNLITGQMGIEPQVFRVPNQQIR